MAVTVRLFAALREAAGTSHIEVAAGSLPEVVDGLCRRFGEPFTTRVRVASGLLDGQPVRLDDDHEVPDGAELALLPPFSGGAGPPGRERQVDRLLLAGSLLLPALLALGVFSDRWAFGLTVVVVGVVSLVDLHMTLGDGDTRTVLPAAAVLALSPVATLLLLPSRTAIAWIPGVVALAVMLTFLLALASPRRNATATIVGSTLLAGLFVASGAGALLLLYDVVPAAQLAGALALIALTDTAAGLVARRTPRPRVGTMVPLSVIVATVAAVAVWVIAGRTAPVLPIAGIALAAVIATLTTTRMRYVLRRPDTVPAPRPALLIGTADAVLFATPLALLSWHLLPSS